MNMLLPDDDAVVILLWNQQTDPMQISLQLVTELLGDLGMEAHSCHPGR
jgi:hypothetical protein